MEKLKKTAKPHIIANEVAAVLDRLGNLKKEKLKNNKTHHEEIFNRVSNGLIIISVSIYAVILLLAAWTTYISPLSSTTKQIAILAILTSVTMAVASLLIVTYLAVTDIFKKENSLFSIFKRQSQNDLKNAELINDISPRHLKIAKILFETKIKRVERRLGVLIGGGSLTILTILKTSWETFEKLDEKGISIWKILTGGYADNWTNFLIYAATVIVTSCIVAALFSSLELRKLRYAVEIAELSQMLKAGDTPA